MSSDDWGGVWFFVIMTQHSFLRPTFPLSLNVVGKRPVSLGLSLPTQQVFQEAARNTRLRGQSITHGIWRQMERAKWSLQSSRSLMGRRQTVAQVQADHNEQHPARTNVPVYILRGSWALRKRIANWTKTSWSPGVIYCGMLGDGRFDAGAMG